MQAGKSLFQSLLWRGLYFISAFIINLLLARHFQASVSGAIYYISSIYALVLLVFSLSLESGIIYFIARKEIPADRLFGFSFGWSLLTGLIVFFSAYFFFRDAYNQLPQSLLLFSAVSFIFGNLLTNYCSGFFYAHNDFAIPNAINIVVTVLLIILLPYNGRSVIPSINNDNYFYIYFGSFMLQGIVISVAAKIKYIHKGVRYFLSWTDFRLLFRYCSLVFAGNVVYFLLYRVDYLFVEKYCSLEQLGNYIQVSKLGHLFFILPTILASAVFPLTAGGKGGNMAELSALLSRALFFIYLLACGVLVITGKWLFPFAFGESFSEMYQPFLFLIPGILSLSGLFTLTAYFAGKGQVKTNIIGSVYALVIILAGDFIFIPLYGINAAAVVSSIGYMVYQAYIVTVFKKEFNMPLGRFFLFRNSDIHQIKNGIGALLTKDNRVS